MEKRVILAVTLSLMVLLIYNSLFPPATKKTSNTPIAIQTIDTKEVVAQRVSDMPTFEPILASSALNEETYILENDSLSVVFTNIGGTIKEIHVSGYSHSMPISSLINIPEYAEKEFKLVSNSNGIIRFEYDDKNIILQKIYEINKDHIIESKIRIKSSDMSRLDNLKIVAFNIDSTEVNKSKVYDTDKNLLEYSVLQNNIVVRKGNAYSFNKKENIIKDGSVEWIAYRDRYYSTIIQPKFKSGAYQVEVISDNSARLLFLNSEKTSLPESAAYEFTIYAGPQSIEKLKTIGLNFEKLVSFSNFSLIDVIAKFSIFIMKLAHKILHNWGVAIIILCGLVYLITYPLTMISMNSMKKMQALQPTMAKLREQYKSNPQRLNKEVMDLYKQNNVNPLSGCFPFILQMPVFIALYQGLWRSFELKGGDFLWIKDLSEPDRLFRFPTEIPLIGHDFNLLPFIMAGVAYFQQKVTMKNMVVTDESQAMQQKLMGNILPVMLCFIFYKFSSGLTLYFTVFYTLQLFSQWKMSKIK